MKTSASLPILHGSNISPYVRKVRVTLAFKAIEYRSIQQSPFNASVEFKAKSPLSKIPCWEDGDLVLPDSSVIVGYLEHRYPSPSLFPDNPEERARALWFEEYADTKLGETVAAVFFQRVVRPNVLKQKTDSKHLEHLLNQALPEVCDYLTACLGDHEYMTGGQFSIADIAITSPFVNFALAGEAIDKSRWPSLSSYIERIHAIPCYAPIVRDDLNGPFSKFRPKSLS